jgi:hypothetical protein
MNDREEAEATGVNGVRLEPKSLRTAFATNNRRTADRVARYDNVIRLICAIYELNARPFAQVLSSSMNVPNVVVICDKAKEKETTSLVAKWREGLVLESYRKKWY